MRPTGIVNFRTKSSGCKRAPAGGTRENLRESALVTMNVCTKYHGNTTENQPLVHFTDKNYKHMNTAEIDLRSHITLLHEKDVDLNLLQFQNSHL